jgi:hypothetical protein
MAAEDGVTEAPEAHAAAADAPEMEEDEGERAADGEGLGNALPVARVKRIMRKNPDKKKNFSKDTVLAVSMATVSSLRPRWALHRGHPGASKGRAPCARPVRAHDS